MWSVGFFVVVLKKSRRSLFEITVTGIAPVGN